MAMKKQVVIPVATNAVFTLAEIKAATEAFDRGDSNVFDALDAIVVAVEAYRTAANEKPKRHRRPRRAA